MTAEARAATATWLIPALAATLLLALVLRLLGLEARPAFDEAASWAFASLPWRTFLQVMWRFEGNGIAYYLTLRGWLQFGESLYFLRLLSVLLGVGTVGVIYLLGARLFGTRVGLFAAVLLALHAFHIRFSQEARGYALTTLLLVLSAWLFLEMQRRRSTWLVASYVVVSALAVYGHLLSVLVLAAQWLWLLAGPGWPAVRRGIAVAVALAAAAAPALWYAVAQNEGQIDWIKPLDRYRFMNEMASLAGGGKGVLLAFALLGGVAVAQALWWKRETAHRQGVAFLCFWAVFPIAVLVALAPIRSMFVDRYLLMCVPALILLAAVAIDGLLDSAAVGLRWLGGAAGLCLIGLTGWATLSQYRDTASAGDPLRETTEYVTARLEPGDGVILFTAATYFPYVYYSSRRSADAAALPETTILFPDFGGLPSGLQPNPGREQIRTAIAGRNRVWLLLNRSAIRLVKGAAQAEPEIRGAIEEGFVLKSDESRGFMQMQLYEAR
jgi:mannosyltransferase